MPRLSLDYDSVSSIFELFEEIEFRLLFDNLANKYKNRKFVKLHLLCSNLKSESIAC